MIKKFLSSGLAYLSIAMGLSVAAGLKSPDLGIGLLAWYGFLALLSMMLWVTAEGMKDTPRPFLKGTAVFLQIANAFVPLVLYAVFGNVTLSSAEGLAKVALVEVATVILSLLLGSAMYNKVAGRGFTVSPFRFMFS